MDLQCKYSLNYGSNLYTCEILKASIKEPKSKVKSISGVHDEDRNNKDVGEIIIRDTVVEYFTKGLIDMFPHLKNRNYKQNSNKQFIVIIMGIVN